MKTIIIKNLSTILDECAVMICESHVASLRNRGFVMMFEDSRKRFNVDVRVDRDEINNRITYTVTDMEAKDE